MLPTEQTYIGGTGYLNPVQGKNLQWSHIDDGDYALAGKTVKKLPAGVYRTNVDSYGKLHFKSLPIVTDKLIRFPSSTMDELIETMRKFWDSEQIYKEFDQVFKRGILLWPVRTSSLTFCSTWRPCFTTMSWSSVLRCLRV